MTKFFNETDYENIIIEIFQNMGYNHIYGPSIEKRDFLDERLWDKKHR